MAYSVRLLPRAAEDAERIYRRVVQEAPVRGREWYARLIESLDSLKTYPERCPVVESLSKPDSLMRRFLYGRRFHTYCIYFDIVGDTVRVFHIRHGRRKEPRRRDLFG
jgi:plasmid stabilization system protein ParE